MSSRNYGGLKYAPRAEQYTSILPTGIHHVTHKKSYKKGKTNNGIRCALKDGYFLHYTPISTNWKGYTVSGKSAEYIHIRSQRGRNDPI